MPAEWYDPNGLPKFDHPPVIEVALSIEFSPVPGLDNYKLSRLQGEWEDRYPTITEMIGAPPTPSEINGSQQITINLPFGEMPRRVWAASADNVLLIQSQTDRLILNWRKVEGATYPGYSETLRVEFGRLWEILLAYLERSGLSAPIPLLAEFTYVNSVPLGEDDTLERVLTIVQRPEKELPGRDRFTQFQIMRDVPKSDDDPYTTQIHIVGQPQFAVDGNRQLVFTVVGRSVLGADTDRPLTALDAAHALASHTFARLVTPEKQAEWGRIQ